MQAAVAAFGAETGMHKVCHVGCSEASWCVQLFDTAAANTTKAANCAATGSVFLFTGFCFSACTFAGVNSKAAARE